MHTIDTHIDARLACAAPLDGRLKLWASAKAQRPGIAGAARWVRVISSGARAHAVARKRRSSASLRDHRSRRARSPGTPPQRRHQVAGYVDSVQGAGVGVVVVAATAVWSVTVTSATDVAQAVVGAVVIVGVVVGATVVVVVAGAPVVVVAVGATVVGVVVGVVVVATGVVGDGVAVSGAVVVVIPVAGGGFVAFSGAEEAVFAVRPVPAAAGQRTNAFATEALIDVPVLVAWSAMLCRPVLAGAAAEVESDGEEGAARR